MSTEKSLGQVAAYKPLSRLGMEELAARQKTIQMSGGVAFARNEDGEQKAAAREMVLALFHPNRWPDRLHMLTMPSVQWRFERKLFGMRDDGWLRKPAPQRTFFTACENDRAIYFAAVAQMPGLHTTLKRIRPFRFAEMGMKTPYASFFFANVDDFMTHKWGSGWDAAWLDYTGPLTIERLAVIKRFYQYFVRRILIITTLKARYNDATAKAIEKTGGHSAWLRKHLDGQVLHDIEYHDTSPMVQFAIEKYQWKSPLV